MTSANNSHRVLHRLRVIIVEDDPADAELIVSELRKNGFEVLWERVETEEQYLARLAGIPEIVLADYSLPQLARSIVGKYVWNGEKTGASEDEVALDSKLVSVLEDWQKRSVPTPEGWLFANADTKRPVHGDVIQKDYLRPAGETVGLLGVGWHTFRHTYRTLIDDVGTPLGVQQRLMRHADIKTTMNTYGSAFEKSNRRANSRVAALVLPPAIKKQLKDRAKEVSLQNLKPETTAIQ